MFARRQPRIFGGAQHDGAQIERDAAIDHLGSEIGDRQIAPDIDEEALIGIADAARRHGIDGLIATNTTIAREAVAGLPHAHETGGLSGAPLFQASNAILARLRERVGPDYPLIGVGGVMSGADAVAKRAAGADLVQIYTGLIYRGPALVPECARAMRAMTAS